MSETEYPTTGQQATVILVAGGAAQVAAADIILAEDKGIVVEVTDSPTIPEKGDRVTVLYAAGDGVMRLKTRCVVTHKNDRWMLRPEAPPVRGERRDYCRATVPVRLKVMEDIGSSVEEGEALVREAARQTPVEDLPELEANVSGSGIKFPVEEPLEPDSIIGLLIALDPERGPVHGVVARMLRMVGSNAACAFRGAPPSLQEGIVTAVFRLRYGELMGERRDFYRATLDVGVRILQDLPTDKEERLKALEAAHAKADLKALERVVANVSGSGIKFPGKIPGGAGLRCGLQIALNPDSGPVYTVGARVVRAGSGQVACTFQEMPADLQDDIVSAVLKVTYADGGGEE